MIFGTPEYMSPEQAAGRRMDLRVDVYAAGVILLEMLTGSVPFTGDTFFGVLNAHMNEPVPAVSALNSDVRVSPELEAVVVQALAKNPDERFSSMRDLANALIATPEGAALDPYTRKSLIPTVTLAEFDAAASAREVAPSAPDRGPSRAAVAQTVPATSGASRPDTLVAEERSAPATPSRRGALWIVPLLAVLGAAGFFAFRFTRNGAATPASSAELAPPPTPAPPPSLAPTPSVVVAPLPSEKPPPGVKLEVKTVPEGAVLFKNGFQVCDTTPCEIDLTPNESVTLEAKKGALKGSAKVLAQHDQNVEIKLSAPATGHAKPPQKVWCYREVQKGEMKTLEKFRCPQ
jgi:serine/threonine-protein kinase